METAGARERVPFGKRLGQPRDWFVEQVEDRPVGGVAQWLRQCSSSSQVRSGKRRPRSLTDSHVGELLAGEGAALAGV